MAHILALYRQTVSLSRLVRSGHVVQRLDAAKHTLPVARRLRGMFVESTVSGLSLWCATWGIGRFLDSVLGLVGVGAIGSRIATRAQAFGVHVVFHDPVVSDSTAQTLNIERAKSLQHLASISDCVSINCPLTLGTTNLIGCDFIGHMKRGSFLVNTSRGRVVNEPCVIEGLRSGQLGGCALDVTELEPVTQFHPLVRMDSAIITPHTAWYSQESLHELRSTAAQIVLEHITQSKLRNVVNQQYLP
jgi:lactate dehydrogenase-like 2-hydroxyacid dehydrogenase